MSAARSVVANFIAKTDQNITFGPSPSPCSLVDSTGTVSATGGYSGNPVIFTSQTTDKCSLGNSTVSGNTSSVTVSGISAGTCTITANQTGNDNYNPALPKTLSFEVTIGKTLIVSNLNSTRGIINSDQTGISCGNSCTASFCDGSKVMLRATPVTGYQFSGWGGNCYGYGNSCVLTMDAAKSVTGNFEVFNKRRSSWKRALLAK